MPSHYAPEGKHAKLMTERYPAGLSHLCFVADRGLIVSPPRRFDNRTGGRRVGRQGIL
jgi:hypothetical protein